MQQWLRPEDVRQDFYDTLNLFAKTLQIAIGSAKFHEEHARRRRSSGTSTT